MLGLSVIGGWVRSLNFGNTAKNTSEVVEKDTVNNVSPVLINNPINKVAYRTDTLARAGSTLLFYNYGTITRNYVENNNGYRLQMPYFAHEDWHHHNDKLRYRTRFYFSPVEYYKLCMHDEISANIVAVLTARYEYMAAPSNAEKKKIIAKYKNSYLKFYFEEVEKGKIKPHSKNSADFEKEMSFIANATQEMWIKKYSAHYAPRTYRMLQRYVGRLGLVEDSKKNYSFVLDYMYTIGGVNFAKYMKHDIDTSDDKVKLAEQLRKVKSMRAGGLKIMNYVNDAYHLMQKISFNNTYEAFQNLLISAQLKYMLQGKTAEELQKNPQLVNLSFTKIMSKIRSDAGFKKAVLSYPLISGNRVNINNSEKADKETIRQMYAYQGLDLMAMISNYQQEALPVQNAAKSYIFENFAGDYMQTTIPDKSEKNLIEPSLFSLYKEETSAENTAVFNKRRISAVQYLNIPNFREPILTSATAGDYFQIIQCMREFADMPQVLKECNTAAQKKYWREHPEIAKKYMQNQK